MILNRPIMIYINRPVMIYINRPVMIYINRPIMIYINRPIMIYFLICSFNVFFIMVFYYGVYNFKLYFFINVYKI